jgi:hypothetical protein
MISFRPHEGPVPLMPRAALPWVDPVRVSRYTAGSFASTVAFVEWTPEREAGSGGRPILDRDPAERLGRLAPAWRTLPPALDTIASGDTTSDLGIPFIGYRLPIVAGIAAATRVPVVRVARAFAAPGEHLQ